MRPARYQQAMELFLAACPLVGERQRQYLDEACGEDLDLRREVESLLQHHSLQTVSTKPQVAPVGRRKEPSSRHPRRIAKALFPDIRPVRTIRMLVAAGILTVSLAVVGFWLSKHIELSLQQNVSDHLESVLAANVLALREWVAEKQAEVRSWAAHDDVREHIIRLAEYNTTMTPSPAQLRAAPDNRQLLKELRPVYQREGSFGVGVISRDGVNLAHSRTELTGAELASENGAYLRRVLDGETILAKPSTEPAYSVGHPLDPDQPLMAVATPVLDNDQRRIAVLAFAFPANAEFADLLSSIGLGASAESFIVDDNGMLLSNLKNPRPLREAGLIGPSQHPALRVTLRDPGAELTSPAAPRRPDDASLPLTLLARSVAARPSGININISGYRNVVGQRVVGAWLWLPEYEFAVATEMAYREAFAPLHYVDTAFVVLFLILGLLVLALLLSSGSVLRLGKHADQARRLGQYTLETQIGEGGMGKVYLARHEMLQRPTAVKLFEGEHADPSSVERFEREVQLTSRLTHPNTIQIFDFGRTDENTFYYAMEFLSGFDLSEVVASSGPLPPARVVHILRQVVGSLREAHAAGLIHRDIKPANIMVCRLWGQTDVVKVLDFGLVKEVAAAPDTLATRMGEIVGTPRYMAPERLTDPDHVDARSDLYAVGAVGYFLLTGNELFADCRTPVQVLMQAVSASTPQADPAELAELAPELGELVSRCLSPLPHQRPRDAEEVAAVLERLSLQWPWTPDDAATWWHQHHPRMAAPQDKTARVAGDTAQA